MKDKELLLEAIKTFDKFNKSQKTLLSLIIEFAKDSVANISIDSLASLSGLSKTIIYKNLTKLEQSNFITREKLLKEKIGYIKINSLEFEQVKEFHLKKQKILLEKFTKKEKQ